MGYYCKMNRTADKTLVEKVHNIVNPLMIYPQVLVCSGTLKAKTRSHNPTNHRWEIQHLPLWLKYLWRIVSMTISRITSGHLFSLKAVASRVGKLYHVFFPPEGTRRMVCCSQTAPQGSTSHEWATEMPAGRTSHRSTPFHLQTLKHVDLVSQMWFWSISRSIVKQMCDMAFSWENGNETFF